MIITYYFGKDGEDDFEYEVDVNNYLKFECSPQELVSMAREYWDDGMSEEDKNYWKSEGIDKITDDTDSNIIAEILSDVDDEWFDEHYHDDIKDTYEDEAREAYEDAKAFERDPYGYNGVSPSDFF